MGSYLIYPIVYSIAVLFYILIRGRLGFSIFLLILFFFSALRGDVGNDACSYQQIFNHFNLNENSLHFGRIEPVYALMNIILNYMGLSYQSIFVTVAAIQSIVYFKLYKYTDRNTKWLLVFLVLMYYYSLQFNSLRYGLSVIIFSLTFMLYLHGNQKLAIFTAIMSLGMHVASAPLLLLLRRGVIKFIIILVITLIFYDYFIDKGLLISKLNFFKVYADYDLSFRANIGMFIIRNTVLLIVILWLVRDNYYKYLFLFFIIVVGILDAFAPVVGRFSEAYVFMLIVYLLYVGVKKKKILFLVPFIFLSTYSDIIAPILKGDEILSKLRDTPKSGVKYHFFFEDEFLVCKYIKERK